MNFNLHEEPSERMLSKIATKLKRNGYDRSDSSYSAMLSFIATYYEKWNLSRDTVLLYLGKPDITLEIKESVDVFVYISETTFGDSNKKIHCRTGVIINSDVLADFVTEENLELYEMMWDLEL